MALPNKHPQLKVSFPALLSSETSAVGMNCPQPDLKQGSCWPLGHRLHNPHPSSTELGVRRYGARPGSRLPGAASFPALVSHWEAVAHGTARFSAGVGLPATGARLGLAPPPFTAIPRTPSPRWPPSPAPPELACVQTRPGRRGQVMRIKLNVSAYLRHREGNEHRSDMI